MDDRDNLDTVIESAYRQIYFHAFKSDRDVNLESQLRGRSDHGPRFRSWTAASPTRFKRSFYGFNSNYKVVRHLVREALRPKGQVVNQKRSLGRS